MDEAKDEANDEAATDGAGRVASLFVTSLVGGLVAVGGVVQFADHRCCRGASARATSEAREVRARCLELGVTPGELARREGVR